MNQKRAHGSRVIAALLLFAILQLGLQVGLAEPNNTTNPVVVPQQIVARLRTNNNLGTVYFRTKRYQEAAASFKEATRLKPDYGEAHFNLALTYVALNDRKAALEQYNRLKQLDPKLADQFFQKYIKK